MYNYYHVAGFAPSAPERQQMNNTTATLAYRAEVSAAVTEYTAQLRFIHNTHGCPIPVTPECGAAMQAAWDAFIARRLKADLLLDARRTQCLRFKAAPA